MSLVDTFGDAAKSGEILNLDVSVMGVETHGIEGRWKTQKAPAVARSMGKTKDKFAFLCYAETWITQIEHAGLPVLSGPFSGCFMAVYKKGGKTYVGHIGTVSGTNVDVKTAWTDFENAADGTGTRIIRAFNPWRSLAALPLVKQAPYVPPPKPASETVPQKLERERAEAQATTIEAARRKALDDLTDTFRASVLRRKDEKKDAGVFPQLYAFVTEDVEHPLCHAALLWRQTSGANDYRVVEFAEVREVVDRPLFPPFRP